MSALLPLLLLIPLWLLLVRPQQRRIRAQQAMVRTLEVGDDVLTSAGIYGSIVDLDDEIVTLQVDDGVHLRIARMAIGKRIDHAEVDMAADDSDLPAPPDQTVDRGPDRPLQPPNVDET